MNKKNIIAALSFSVFANLFSALVSAGLLFLGPKLLDETQYGFWQLSVFYSTYVGFMHFGWADGTYLRYGGIPYDDIDKKIFKSQFILITIFELLLTGLFCLVIFAFSNEYNYMIIYLTFAISCFLQIPATWMRLVLQTTNRIKACSINLIVEKGVYGVLFFILFYFRIDSYKPLLLVDLFSKAISLISLLYICRDILFAEHLVSLKQNLHETYENLSVGIKLLLSNLAGMLVVGIIRLVIENVWSIEIFGKISLVLNISNIFMILVNASSMVLYPLLKRIEPTTISDVYVKMKSYALFILIFSLSLYYPIKGVIVYWLPKYADLIVYLSILFPICLYEGKNSLVITTFMKSLRLEGALLKINFASVCFSFFIGLIIKFIFPNLFFAIFSIVLVLALRCIMGEYLLSKQMSVNGLKDVIVEILVTMLFVFANIYLSLYFSLMIYICIVAFVIYVYRDLLSNLVRSKFLSNDY